MKNTWKKNNLMVQKILEKLAELLGDEGVSDIGNVMRAKRNTDLYDGGVEVTGKECREYIKFAQDVIEKVRGIIGHGGRSSGSETIRIG